MASESENENNENVSKISIEKPNFDEIKLKTSKLFHEINRFIFYDPAEGTFIRKYLKNNYLPVHLHNIVDIVDFEERKKKIEEVRYYKT
jgi:hypothetical protein